MTIKKRIVTIVLVQKTCLSTTACKTLGIFFFNFFFKFIILSQKFNTIYYRTISSAGEVFHLCHTGAVFSNTEAIFSNTGAISSNTGAVFSNTGAIYNHNVAIGRIRG